MQLFSVRFVKLFSEGTPAAHSRVFRRDFCPKGTQGRRRLLKIRLGIIGCFTDDHRGEPAKVRTFKAAEDILMSWRLALLFPRTAVLPNTTTS